MLFSELFKYIPSQLPKHLQNQRFRALQVDSRKVSPQDVFIAQTGYTTNSHQFISELLEKNIWIIKENNYFVENTDPKVLERIISVPSTTHILAALSKAFFGDPDLSINIIGVTGTNGKTTTTTIIHQILTQLNIKTGLIGTIQNQIGNQIIPSKNTTPDAFHLYELLAKMKESHCQYVVMEISSHALKLKRVENLALNTVLFTNLTPEHLDFHKNMEEYLYSKFYIFDLLAQSPKTDKYVIYNQKSSVASKIRQYTQKLGLLSLSFSVSNRNNNSPADYHSIITHSNIKGTQFELYHKIKILTSITTNLQGIFNIENIMAAMLTLIQYSIPLEKIIPILNHIQVQGRFQDITPDFPFSVIIDYAHSPDALENILKTAKNLQPKKLIIIFGCGGDRDKTKRPIMGQIASELSDIVIITSDNPRTENPYQILKDIQVGITNKTRLIPIVNRQKAIQKGLSLMETGDMLIIAGKGHENYQIFKYKTIPFSDEQIVKNLLKDSFYGK